MALSEIILRLAVALLLGGAIGFERQWRSHYAGLRTNTLISVGSAGIMLFAILLPYGDPTSLGRIAGQIVTGVGFLCAGVIMHEGINVKGLNTSATLWCSTCVGMFAGVGLFTPAVILTLFLVSVNLLLRPVVYYINSRTPVSDELDAHYVVSIGCAVADAARIRATVLPHMGADSGYAKNLETELQPGAAKITLQLLFSQRMDARVEALAAKIGREPGVTAIKWYIG